MLPKIYALCDFATLQKRNCSLEEFVALCKENETAFIQYRDKTNPLEIQKKNLLELKSLTNIPVIINDQLELLEFCDGLHLGQEDIDSLCNKFSVKSPIELFYRLKKSYPGKIIGISTHNVKEVEEANGFDIDYIGLGAYRATDTKDVSNILGEELSRIASHSKHPVAAIGGVKKDDNIKNVTYNVIGSGMYK